jgi:FkbM family methyltransferase
MTTLDIGAHVGYYTLLMAKRVGKEGHVFAFEPNPVVRKYIEQNVQRNGYAQVEISPYALFSKGGFGILEGRDNLNSCLSLQSAPTDRSIQIAVFDQVKKDLGIDRVDLIKMDVEGAELDILHGMRGLIGKHHPSLIIEVHRNGLIHFQHSESEIREYLKSFGYTMKDIWSQIGTITVLGKWNAPER